MQETPNLKLKKPDLTDYVNVGDLNENADLIDGAVTENKEGLAAHVADYATLTKKGHVQLSNATNSTSDTLAATPKAVKDAMDRADAAFTSASNGKQTVGNAITGVDSGIEVPTNPTFQQLSDAIGNIEMFTFIPGDVAVLSSPDTSEVKGASYIKVKEITVNFSGSVRVSYSMRKNNSVIASTAQIRINDSIDGVTNLLPSNSRGPTTFTLDTSVEKGDKIQVFASANNASYAVYIEDFQIKIDSGLFGSINL